MFDAVISIGLCHFVMVYECRIIPFLLVGLSLAGKTAFM
jgi:hypothetical protein